MLHNLFLFLGSLIIGLGLGLIVGNYFSLSFTYLWLSIITSLVGGGFLLALSLRRGNKNQLKKKGLEQLNQKEDKDTETPKQEEQFKNNN